MSHRRAVDYSTTNDLENYAAVSQERAPPARARPARSLYLSSDFFPRSVTLFASHGREGQVETLGITKGPALPFCISIERGTDFRHFALPEARIANKGSNAWRLDIFLPPLAPPFPPLPRPFRRSLGRSQAPD